MSPLRRRRLGSPSVRVRAKGDKKSCRGRSTSRSPGVTTGRPFTGRLTEREEETEGGRLILVESLFDGREFTDKVPGESPLGANPCGQ